jgi:hypothetical protein
MTNSQTWFRTISVSLLLMISLAGCEDDPGQPEALPARISVKLMPAGTALAGIKVVVMDPATNEIVAGPVVSDESGVCAFPGLAPDSYALLAFGGAEYEVGSLPAGWNHAGTTARDRSNPLAAAKDPVEANPEVRMLVRTPPGGLPRIAGQVVDHDTGQPLDGAFLSTSPFLTGYQGQTYPADDVTGPDGRFLVHDIPFSQDPFSGNLIQVQPLYVNCQGYEPTAWTVDLPNGEDNLDIAGVTIALRGLDPGTATGSLSGRLVLQDEPVSGVLVGLGSVGGSEKGAAGQPGYTTFSDEEGVFLFVDLPAGEYLIHPAFLLHDGYALVNQAANVPYQVLPDQLTDAGGLVVLREVVMVSPAGALPVGDDFDRVLTWHPVPGAVTYEVFLDRGFVGTTTETSIGVPAEWTLTQGWHIWYALALDDQEYTIGFPEDPALFFITAPDPP